MQSYQYNPAPQWCAVFVALHVMVLHVYASVQYFVQLFHTEQWKKLSRHAGGEGGGGERGDKVAAQIKKMVK